MKKHCLILTAIVAFFSVLITQAQTPYEGIPKEFVLDSASEMNALDWVNMSHGTYKNPKKSAGFDQRGSTHQVITLKVDDVNACMSYRYKGGEENVIIESADKAYLQTLPNIADWDTAKDGTLRALRLGDDISNNPVASQITYSFKPDEERNVLMVYFAFVAAGPHHYYMENPLFNIEILKADNTLINTDDPKKSYFLVNPKGQSINENPLAHNEILMAHDKYYVCKSGDGIDHSDIHWIDWTPVVFNLHDYIGEEIQLRITTTDCLLRGHFAYGYFVVRSFNGSDTLALKEFTDIESRVQLYPNPASTQITVASEAEIAQIEILNANGQLVATKHCYGTKEEQIDITSYSTGIYLMRIKNSAGIVTKKFIVQ